MKHVYPKALEAFLSGQVDLTGDTIKAQLLDATYTYSAAHDFLDDVSGGAKVGTAVTLAGKAVTGGQFTATDPVWSSVASGDTVTAVVVYQDTGSAGTSRLLAYIDRLGGEVPISVATNGGGITFDWPSNLIFTI